MSNTLDSFEFDKKDQNVHHESERRAIDNTLYTEIYLYREVDTKYNCKNVILQCSRLRLQKRVVFATVCQTTPTFPLLLA